ncbi:3-hydroxyisobutyrate dehydrogenase [Chitinophaga sp. S165]|nr:3-hydroxyisobutyrate dehydrogenase [Chitinophaga sp. S165]
MTTAKIGWIGLGKMGGPMSQQLIKAGYGVTAYNRNKDREAAIQAMGASSAVTPAAVILQSDIVFLMVSDDNATRDVFTGNNGLLSVQTSGKIIINMSTVSPAVSKDMAALCAAQGNTYLDAPVSGSVKQAEDALLVIMVGGDNTAFQQVKPILEKMGKLVLLTGDTGAGNNTKLAVNTLLAIFAQGLAETVTFANQQHIRTEDLMAVINNSALGNVFGKIKGDAIMNDNYKAAFALKHIAKDLRLAKAEGLSSPLATVAADTFHEAEGTLGEEDIIAIIKKF